jgi:hypothetical protein
MNQISEGKPLLAAHAASARSENTKALKGDKENPGNRGMPKLELVAASLALTGLLAAAPVHAESFEFTFQGDPTIGLAGMVEGVITGLNSSGSSAAQTVTITEYPVGLTPLPPVTVNVDVLDAPFNQFTVSGGTVTAANFYGSTTAGISPNFQLFLSGGSGFAYLESNDYSNVVQKGVAPTFTPLPVPELPAPLMLGSGMLVALLARRRRKNAQASMPDNLAL